MSKEKLEEIVEKISEQTFDRLVVPQTKIAVEYQDIKFLINTITEQAERVEELEQEKTILRNNVYLYRSYFDRMVGAEEENKRLSNTLKYYADERIYDPQYKLDIMRDCGRQARKTLKEIKK